MNKILIIKNKSKIDDYFGDQLNKFAGGKAEYVMGTYDELFMYMPNTGSDHVEIKINNVNIADYDLVYFRNWLKLDTRSLAVTIVRYLEHKKIKFLESVVAKSITTNKLYQTVLLQLGNFPTPKSIYLSRKHIEENIDYLFGELGSEIIMKDINYNKGRGNHLVKSKDEIVKVNNEVAENRNFLFQEFIPNSFDYRFLVLEDNVAVSERRVRTQKNTHLNNISEGNKEEFFDPKETPDLVDLSLRSAKYMQMEIAGVDIVVSDKDGKPYIFELNAAPGLTYNSEESPEIEELGKYLLDKLN